MTLEEAKTWFAQMLTHPDAFEAALRVLQEADDAGVKATLIAGRQITASERCILARWTGQRLVVVQLSEALQHDFRVAPSELFQKIDTPREIPEVVAEPLITLSDVQFEDTDSREHEAPWRATCQFSVESSEAASLPNCFLRAEYFRTDLPADVTTFWRPNVWPLPAAGIFSIELPPPGAFISPDEICGAVVVFLQAFTGDEGSQLTRARPISQVVAAVVGDN